MSDKVLKAYRILPKQLYVVRKADRQLKAILDDMASPGYVLVSRQMGKTNLLLHAKNEYEQPNDVFVYIDLSNVFETSKECFRNIVDKAIEINSAKIGFVKKEIDKKRKSQNIAAHLEHVQELRIILSSITGKLVIILDEIDALIKTNYSDEIFKQIRSSYFDGRSNFPEFNRLTYFLSGVIDPKQIIKDPRISPFNIGQKIFLDDFTYEEVVEFVSKAKLQIEENIIKELFEWTNGNPRILFDVCSEIENFSNEKIAITSILIDRIINQLYLTYFDKPPIDHIRELVEFDAELRKAVYAIHYHKSESISIDVRNKLYLAGILNSDFSANNLKLKNKIIEYALNLKWLDEIDRKKKSLIDLGVEAFTETDYNKTVRLFEEYLESNSIKSLHSSRLFILASSYFNIGRYEDAIRFFEQTTFDRKGYAAKYYELQYLLGLSYYNLQRYKEALPYFIDIVSNDVGGIFYYPAWNNLGSLYINLDFEKYKNEFFKSNDLLIETLHSEIKDSENNTLKDVLIKAYLNQANAYKLSGDYSNSINFFDKALEECYSDIRPSILLSKYHIVENVAEKEKTLNEAIQFIIDNKLSTHQTTSDNYFSFSKFIIDALVTEAFKLENQEYFDRFLSYLASNSKSYNYNPSSVLINLGQHYLKQGNRDLSYKAYEKIVNNYSEETDYFIVASKYLLINVDRGFNFTLFNSYFETIKSIDKTIDSFDQRIFTYYIAEYQNDNKFSLTYDLIEFILNSKVIDEAKFNQLIFYFFQLQVERHYNHSERALEISNLIQNFLKNNKRDESNSAIFLSKDIIKIITDAAYSVVDESKRKEYLTYDKMKDHKPNDKVKVIYNDGRIIESIKFKKVKVDYAEGRCRIIEVFN